MKAFEFTIKFMLGDPGCDPESCVDRLYESGCDDALIGIGNTGMIALDFTREAENALEAVMSAIEDVKQAIPDAQLVEATPDLVGLTDIAEILGQSRQYIRKLWTSNSAAFPAPVHAGKSAIWHLSSVLNWLQSRNTTSVEFSQTLIEISSANMQINVAKEASQLDPLVTSRLSASI